MSTVVVLWMVFFLHNGGVMTKGITTQSLESCQTDKVLIEDLYRAGKFSVGSKDVKIRSIVSECRAY